jgi:hypothetical protein
MFIDELMRDSYQNSALMDHVSHRCSAIDGIEGGRDRARIARSSRAIFAVDQCARGSGQVAQNGPATSISTRGVSLEAAARSRKSAARRST